MTVSLCELIAQTPNNSIFERDIDCLATAGVTKGCNPPDNTRYCPTGYVTRGQMAAFLHRAPGEKLALARYRQYGRPRH